MDQRPGDQEWLWQRLRSLGPPAGARERVLRRIEQGRRARHPLRWAALFALPAAAALVVVLARRPEATPAAPPRVELARAPVAVAPAREPMRVAANGTVRFSLQHAQVISKGPAVLEVGEDSLLVREGSALVDGKLVVQGAACANRVEGRARVSVTDSRVVIAVFEGRVQPVADLVSCDVVPGTEPHARRARAAAPPLEEPVQVPEPLVEEPSELARMVSAYRAAIALETHDDEAALAALQKLRSDWPGGALEPEIDLRIVDALLRLGRTGEARVAADAFAEHHPESARAGEMRSLAAGGAK